ncbi:type IV secretion system protein VirD4 [Sinorhizobium terangae]|uniref:Type IV secretion system ATPase VirD4 n=1 Tax=Sinorhizobium terangae TaxID=110322 RepID=A0A6N7LFG1_SINTE|nr:type IV secretion system ATPase VirD4 [Sinorhizobium terangae]MBB4189041.1 type IV secretion system protein VirD4 [Sinorhizobium terangae]MQX15655.1 type IV secretion system ATPase VirD4 [Sinorhizobium terangae]
MIPDKNAPASIILSIMCSLAAGFCAASLYATFRYGFSGEAMMTFDILAFWYETPFYLGYTTPAFYRGLAVVVLTSGLVLLVQRSVCPPNREHHGTARWARLDEMRHAGYLQRYSRLTGPVFGKTSGPFWCGYYLTNGEQPHSLVVAPTRAGKGVGIVIPTLLTFKGSVIALDVKGELFELTSRARRAAGDHVFKFTPLDPERRTNCYNPLLDIIALPPERQFIEARRLAANLITAKGEGAEGFINGARDLFVAGILACIERGTPTIGAVYDLFAQPGEKYKLFARLAEETQNKEAQRIFDNMAGNDTKILTSYTSVLGDGGLNLWADPLVKAATSRSDFSIYDLRRRRTCIYLCVSPNDLEVLAPLMRLLFQQIVSVLQRSLPGTDEKHEVLFLLDEFKHLGKLETIETAITTIAGYKGRFMFIIQSLSALTGTYDEAGKQNFLSNTGLQVFMATADDETPTYISEAIGDYTFQARSISHGRGLDRNIQISDQGARLLRSEQVRLLDDECQIVLIKGQPPLKLRKVRYYSDRVLKRIFESQTGDLPEPARLTMSEEDQGPSGMPKDATASDYEIAEGILRERPSGA